jgi:methionyl aminopeptidase
MAIVCKSASEIERMRQSGRIVRQVLDHVRSIVKPGLTTMDLEHAAEKKIDELGAKPAFKGYYDYPCVLCTSVNEEIVHGIPSEKRELKDGDIVSIDCGVVLDGYYGDAAITVPVSETVKPELRKLLTVTEESLYRGIDQARIGNSVGDVGAAVQEYVEAALVWCANSWDMESAHTCTKSLKFRIMELAATVQSYARVWCSRSSRW